MAWFSRAVDGRAPLICWLLLVAAAGYGIADAQATADALRSVLGYAQPASERRLPWMILMALGSLGVLALSQHRTRRISEQLLFVEREQADQAFEYAPIGMALIDLDGHWLRVNTPLCRMLGYSHEELQQDHTFQNITHPDDLSADFEHLSRLLSGDLLTYTLEKRYISGSGEIIWALVWVSVAWRPDGTPQHLVVQMQDVTEQRRLQHELEHLAVRDPLTGAWNRRRFDEVLDEGVLRARRYGEQAALLVIDIDRFKTINDSYGHKVGDDLICAVAAAIDDRVRSTDHVARLGGDEFAVLLTHVGPDHAAAIAEGIADAVCQTKVRVDNGEVSVTVSIGIAFLDRSVRGAEQVIVQADLAMYTAKAAGRNRAITAGNTDRIRVYHCDDSPAFRRLVEEMLHDHDDIEIVGTAASYTEALAEAPELAPDVMLVDLHTGDEPDDPVHEVRTAVPGARVVVFSASDSSDLARLHAQADAALSKSVPFDALATALRGVAHGTPAPVPSR